MSAIIIIGIIIFIIYAASSKEKQTTNSNYKYLRTNDSNNHNRMNTQQVMQENMNANLKIVDNVRIKCKALVKIIEITYDSKACPKCNQRKMTFSNVVPTGQFITCECSNCSKVQTFKLIAGKNGSKVIQVRDEIKHLLESIILPVPDDFWKIDIDYSFIVNSEPDSITSNSTVLWNFDTKLNTDSNIDISNIKHEYTVLIKDKPQKVVLYNFEGKVPYWENRVISSHTEINNTHVLQSIFYNQFKSRFLNDDYFDLQGNSNYAFILYYELLADYIDHRDIDKLEKQLLILAECFPETKSCVSKSLAKEFVLKSAHENEEKLKVQFEKVNDDSIIDITPLSHKIYSTNNLQKYANGVPYWAHHYVYSYSEIDSSSSEQKKFYSIFKSSFLKCEYFDLEGNTNYAFILLFDLQDEFYKHKDIPKLESQLKVLGECYPKTKSYGVSFLIENMERDYEGILKLKIQDDIGPGINDIEDNYGKLGSKYKIKLNLNDEEVNLLDETWYSESSFMEIDHCCVEVLKLFNSTISELKNDCILNNTTLDLLLTSVADVVVRKEHRYRAGSTNYNYSLSSTAKSFYYTILRHCEKSVYSLFIEKKQIELVSYYTSPVANQEIETKLYSKINKIITQHFSKIILPDEITEIELYAIAKNRWKMKFEELTSNYEDSPKKFVEDILLLGNLNKKNPSIKNIFFDASKFIAKYDKEATLILYVHYLFHDLNSVRFDNKQLTKTMLKNLFNTNEQLHEFENIVSELINDKNLIKALKSLSSVYEVKRRKIRLNTTSINEVQQQHIGTVELLNEYLMDEADNVNNTIISSEIINEEFKTEIVLKNEVFHLEGFVSELVLSEIQKLALELFVESNFSVPQYEFDAFAKTKGIFKNQLIESINESCYDLIDDVLIEEEADNYTLNPIYFQKIFAK